MVRPRLSFCHFPCKTIRVRKKWLYPVYKQWIKSKIQLEVLDTATFNIWLFFLPIGGKNWRKLWMPLSCTSSTITKTNRTNLLQLFIWNINIFFFSRYTTVSLYIFLIYFCYFILLMMPKPICIIVKVIFKRFLKNRYMRNTLLYRVM